MNVDIRRLTMLDEATRSKGQENGKLAFEMRDHVSEDGISSSLRRRLSRMVAGRGVVCAVGPSKQRLKFTKTAMPNMRQTVASMPQLSGEKTAVLNEMTRNKRRGNHGRSEHMDRSRTDRRDRIQSVTHNTALVGFDIHDFRFNAWTGYRQLTCHSNFS